MNIGSLNEFLDFECKTYEKHIQQVRNYSVPNPIEKVQTKQIKSNRAIELLTLRNNIQRYNQQLQAAFQQRRKKPVQKSMVVEKPQTVKRHQLASIQIKSPNYLGLFDKGKVFDDSVPVSSLKQKHHLLKTVNDVKQEQNKDKINSLIDQAYIRMQEEFNNHSQTRSQERQQYITKYETYNKVQHNNEEIKVEVENQENSEASSLEMEVQTTRKLKKTQLNEVRKKLDAKKIIQQFPQKRWSKIRNLSYSSPNEYKTQNQQLELNSIKFIEQIIETGKNKKKYTGDAIDKLERIANQLLD
ncbi:unnamed protein product (macronuclear) [Paramecium tetraurelia]|uniref:Uncharacterized protein n=1 Tax=Paramecium tetraurelia TaxID=5888 RepID=A0D7R1_PARTE|nr:uncharacterized protein GSPATT00014045001 [Paramecium tetraurelia]CAK79078.1 unnamed protein product [Paramecium tetraurelia]|eukprot:XP_001446475.1 hypothetical protein (macronuclear) [Paramecium tetraurelia strain d4-2]